MTPPLPVRPSVLLPLRDQRALLSHFFHGGGLGGLFIPGHLRLSSGARVDLEIAFAKEQVTVHSRGIVRWKRLTGRKGLPAGVGVEFLDSERRTRDLLLGYAEGRNVRLLRRGSRRYPATLQIEYATGSVLLSDVSDDVSLGGIAIATDHLVEVGSLLTLRLCLPGDGGTIEVKGEVRWARQSEPRGMGLRFIFDRPGVEQRVARLISRLKHQLAADIRGGQAEATL